MALNFSLVQLSAFSTNLLQEQNHFLSECLKSSCDELIRILKYFRYLDVPMVERERRAWQGDMPVEEVPPKMIYILSSCKQSNCFVNLNFEETSWAFSSSSCLDSGGRVWVQVHHWRPGVYCGGPHKTGRKSIRVRVGRPGTHCQEVSKIIQ